MLQMEIERAGDVSEFKLSSLSISVSSVCEETAFFNDAWKFGLKRECSCWDLVRWELLCLRHGVSLGTKRYGSVGHWKPLLEGWWIFSRLWKLSACYRELRTLAMRQVFFQYFSFPCQSSFLQIPHAHLSSEADILGQSVANVDSLTTCRKLKGNHSHILGYRACMFGNWLIMLPINYIHA
jgi:hypothetical protein